MRRAWHVGQLFLLPSLVLLVALLIAPQRATLAIHVWLLVVLGLAFIAFMRLVLALYPGVPSPFDGSLRRHQPSAERPGSLSRLATSRLTALFSWAKFSGHDVAPEMKQEAIEALEAVREELRAAEILAEHERLASLTERRERAASA